MARAVNNGQRAQWRSKGRVTYRLLRGLVDEAHPARNQTAPGAAACCGRGQQGLCLYQIFLDAAAFIKAAATRCFEEEELPVARLFVD